MQPSSDSSKLTLQGAAIPRVAKHMAAGVRRLLIPVHVAAAASCPADVSVAWPATWSAAVSAATDLQLAATPAFGGRRPDVAWLISTAQRHWEDGPYSMRKGQQAAVRDDLQLQMQPLSKGHQKQQPDVEAVEEIDSANQSMAYSAVALASIHQSLLNADMFLQPVLAAADRLLQQQPSSSSHVAAAVALLQQVCSMFADTIGAKNLPFLYTTLLKPGTQQLLAIVQRHHQLLPRIALLPSALSAVVEIGAAAGDLSLWRAAQEAAAALQLTQENLCELQWAAVTGSALSLAVQSTAAPQAAAAPGDGSGPSTATQQLLQLWPSAIDLAQSAYMPAKTAAAVVAALAQDAEAGGGLSQQLLQEQLPLTLLEPLLFYACIQVHIEPPLAAVQVLQQLMAPVLQRGSLAELQPRVVAALLPTVLADESTVDFSIVLQLVDTILQSGESVGHDAAQRLSSLLAGDGSAQQEFLQYLDHVSGTAAAAAAAAGSQRFLSDLLQTLGPAAAHVEWSWQLFQRLTAAGAGGWQLPAKQVLQTCSMLINQQSSSQTAESDARVLQVWALAQHAAAAGSAAAAVQTFDTVTQQHVLAALVAAQQQQEAAEVIQAAPALLPYLAQLWQQQVQEQVQGQPIKAAAVVQLCGVCVKQDTSAAAEAAELLLVHLKDSETAAALQESGLLLPLTQLLHRHNKAAAVLQLLGTTMWLLEAALLQQQEAMAVVRTAADAVVRTTSSSITAGQQQQQQLVQLLTSSTEAVQVAKAALSALLSEQAPAAGSVALLLHAAGQQGQEQLTVLLQPAELGKLCSLICSSSSSAKQLAAGTDGSLVSLPRAHSLARQCVEHTARSGQSLLPAASAMQLINTLAAEHPELQPSAAATAVSDVLGSEQAASATAAAGGEGGKSAAVSISISTVLLQLCEPPLQAAAAAADDPDDLEALLSEWVSGLTPEAAAAVLFAAWQYWQPHSHESAQLQAPKSVVAPLFCLQLYQRAKLTGDSLVFDLGLLAAAQAAAVTADWHRGEGFCGGLTWQFAEAT